MLIDGCCWLTTQMRPSPARASVRGACPTGKPATALPFAVSMELTVSWSTLTTQIFFVDASKRMDEERVGCGVVRGLKTVIFRVSLTMVGGNPGSRTVTVTV